MIEQVISIALTSMLTTFLIIVFLRFVMNRMLAPISSLTKFGAKIAGEHSGVTRKNKAIINQSAEAILNSPQLNGLKLIGSQLGLDIDDMIEEHGAVETLTGLSQVLSMVGINVNDLVEKGVNGIMQDLTGKSNNKLTADFKLGMK